MWEARPMPWAPELFSADALARLEDKREHEKLIAVPYFIGLMTGEIDPLVRSFSGEPVVHHPVSGRIRGRREFEAFVTDTNGWLAEGKAEVEEIGFVVTERRGFEEVVVHVEEGGKRHDLPIAIVADRAADGLIAELRIYSSSWSRRGRHTHRPPLLQAEPGLQAPGVIGEYQRALAAGDVEAIVATFEPDGYAREPASSEYVHRGAERLRAFYEHLFSNGGGLVLEHCEVTHDPRACVLEYNIVRWGRTELPPEAGVAVYVKGESGRLAAARIYDDCDPPLAP
jgi:hypothetical protein